MRHSNPFCREVLPAALYLREMAGLIFSCFILVSMTQPPATLLPRVLLVPKASLTVHPSKAEVRLAPLAGCCLQPSSIPLVPGQRQSPWQVKEGTGTRSPLQGWDTQMEICGQGRRKRYRLQIKAFLGFLMGLKEKKIVAGGGEGGDAGGMFRFCFTKKRW